MGLKSSKIEVKMLESDKELLSKFRRENPWGMSCSVDLKNCNPNAIRDEKKIKEFVDKLCKLIDMKKFGDTYVVRFGEDPRVSGISMIQLIETSAICGHFADLTNSAYLDIFSCKEYPPYKTAEFCKQFFSAKEVKVDVTFRY